MQKRSGPEAAMVGALPRPATPEKSLPWVCCCCCCGFGSPDGSGAEKALLRWPSWLHRSRRAMESEADLNWWRKGWNSVRRASEWSESAAEDAAASCGVSKWRNFVRRFKAKRPARFQYDPLSYALNFDEGASQEADYPYQDFSARFVAPIRNGKEKGGGL